MLRNTFIILLIAFAINVNAQTGIGTTTPDASAKLDVSATNKGFLPPRVTLTSGTDNTTIPSPATGLLVYNTGNNAGLVAGYYYWNGTSWATIATASGSGVSASILRGSRSSAQTGLTNGGTVLFNQIDNIAGQEMSLNTSSGQITLAAGRTYRLMAQVPNYQTSAAETRTQFAWYNETSGAYIGSSSNAYTPSSGASYGATGGLSEAVITTTTSTVVSYRIAQLSNTTQLGGSADFTNTGAFPWFEAQVISGNTAVNGQSVDYVSTLLTTGQTNLVAGQVIKFQTVKAGNIPYNSSTGYFTLTAGKTYRLTGFASLDGVATNAGAIDIVWRDQNGNDLSNWGSFMSPSYSSNYAGQGVVSCIYTPTSNISVYLCVSYTSQTSNIVRANATSALIEQIGSSAIVNPWTLSGTNTFNTTGNVGIGTNAPAQALDVAGNINVTGKINLTDASGNVATKIAAFVGRGTDVVLGNLKVRFPATGNMSLQVSTVSGAYSVYGSHMLVSSAIAYNAIDGAAPLSITTTPTYLNSGNNFGGAGNTGIWFIMDTGAAICWRISMIIGSGYTNNFISIERLL